MEQTSRIADANIGLRIASMGGAHCEWPEAMEIGEEIGGEISGESDKLLGNL
jgi:hypothetical protein